MVAAVQGLTPAPSLGIPLFLPDDWTPPTPDPPCTIIGHGGQSRADTSISCHCALEPSSQPGTAIASNMVQLQITIAKHNSKFWMIDGFLFGIIPEIG